MKNIAVITARGGSKRIPRKNIKEFCGKPIIAYSIKAALETGLFDEVMVSTEDQEIAEIAKSYGAKVPFFRSEATANDYATTADVLLEVVASYRAMGVEPVNLCCIYPTAPFVTSEMIAEAMEILEREKVSSVVPVVRFSFPPQRAYYMEGNRVIVADPESFPKRSQDLRPMYHDCGTFYCMNVEAFERTKQILMADTMGVMLPEDVVQDIDTPDDWRIAETKYKLMKGL